jgi:type II restriction enzyme
MRSYERILQLRRLKNTPTLQEYELVEIPKGLLLQADHGEFKMMQESTQNPKPGTCTVYSPDGRVAYDLYFDGGTERKLQVRHLRKELCMVHAVWGIKRIPLPTEAA